MRSDWWKVTAVQLTDPDISRSIFGRSNMDTASEAQRLDRSVQLTSGETAWASKLTAVKNEGQLKVSTDFLKLLLQVRLYSLSLESNVELVVTLVSG